MGRKGDHASGDARRRPALSVAAVVAAVVVAGSSAACAMQVTMPQLTNPPPASNAHATAAPTSGASMTFPSPPPPPASTQPEQVDTSLVDVFASMAVEVGKVAAGENKSYDMDTQAIVDAYPAPWVVSDATSTVTCNGLTTLTIIQWWKQDGQIMQSTQTKVDAGTYNFTSSVHGEATSSLVKSLVAEVAATPCV